MVRWAVVTVVVVHRLLHLLGAAKGLGWAQVSRINEPIGAAMGATLLAAAALVSPLPHDRLDVGQAPVEPHNGRPCVERSIRTWGSGANR